MLSTTSRRAPRGRAPRRLAPHQEGLAAYRTGSRSATTASVVAPAPAPAAPCRPAQPAAAAQTHRGKSESPPSSQQLEVARRVGVVHDVVRTRCLGVPPRVPHIAALVAHVGCADEGDGAPLRLRPSARSSSRSRLAAGRPNCSGAVGSDAAERCSTSANPTGPLSTGSAPLSAASPRRACRARPSRTRTRASSCTSLDERARSSRRPARAADVNAGRTYSSRPSVTVIARDSEMNEPPA
jgi:hypothetical protein